MLRRSLPLALVLLAAGGAALLVTRTTGGPAPDDPPVGGADLPPSGAAPRTAPSGGPTLKGPGGAGGGDGRRAAAAAAATPAPLLAQRFVPTGERLVLDASSRPVEGAEVALRWERGGATETVMRVRTGPDGRWTPDWSWWEALPPVLREAGTWSFSVIAKGHWRTVDLRPDAVGSVRLTAGATLFGRVLDGSGAAVPQATVWLLWGPRRKAIDTRTDAQGRFDLSIPTEGPYRLVAVARPVGAARRDLSLDPRRDESLADLVLGGEGTIEGRVVYDDGTPVADVEVQAWHERTRHGYGEAYQEEAAGLGIAGARSGSDGRFRVRGLLPGSCALFVPQHAADFPTWSEVHATGSTDVVLHVRPVRVRAAVVDPEGRPVPGAWLVGRGLLAGMDRPVGVPEATADLWTQPGREVALAARAGQGPWTETVLTAPTDAPEARATLVLRPDDGHRGSLRVRLTDDAGRPVGRARLSLLTPGAEAWIAGSTAAAREGELVLGSVLPGRARLRVRAGDPRTTADVLDDYALPEDRDVEVRADAETSVALKVREGARLRVEARLGEGVPAPPGSLTLWIQASASAPARLVQWFVATPPGADPRVVTAAPVGIPAVAQDLFEPGRYLVSLGADGLRADPVEVTLRPGATTTAAFLLTR